MHHASLKKCLHLFILTLFLTSQAQAIPHRHMLSLGRTGFSWNHSVEKLNTQKSSALDDLYTFMTDLGLNYSYRFTNRIQLGLFYLHSRNELRFKNVDGGSSSAQIETDEYGLELIYNFHDDILDAWYTSLSFSVINLEEENTSKLSGAESKTPFELDDSSYRTTMMLGKRWDLGSLKMAAVTFAPRIGVYYQTHSKDFSDQKATSGIGLSVEPIRLIYSFKVS